MVLYPWVVHSNEQGHRRTCINKKMHERVHNITSQVVPSFIQLPKQAPFLHISQGILQCTLIFFLILVQGSIQYDAQLVKLSHALQHKAEMPKVECPHSKQHG